MSWIPSPPPPSAPPPAAVAAAKPAAAAPKPQQTVVIVAKPERPTGDTTLRCKVTALGQVTSCAVASESPAGRGLGANALRLATRFRVDPPRRAGHPVEGEVLLPFKFQMASEADPAPAKP